MNIKDAPYIYIYTNKSNNCCKIYGGPTDVTIISSITVLIDSTIILMEAWSVVEDDG